MASAHPQHARSHVFVNSDQAGNGLNPSPLGNDLKGTESPRSSSCVSSMNCFRQSEDNRVLQPETVGECNDSFASFDYPEQLSSISSPEAPNPFNAALPFLHPSDLSTYSTLPSSIRDSTNLDASPLCFDSPSRLGSFDWSGSDPQSYSLDTPQNLQSLDRQVEISSPVSVREQSPEAALESMYSPSSVSTSTSVPSSSCSASPVPYLESHKLSRGPQQPSTPPSKEFPQSLQQSRLTLEMEHTLLNRLQWYTVVCKLRKETGEPLLTNRVATVSDSVAFLDGRRKQDSLLSEANVPNVIVTAVVRCASTGKMLEKCRKCCEKDKALRKRKRKRDEEVLWTEQDEEMNSKLVQIYSTGAEQFNEEGDLAIRLRIGCCVGVTKQHHLNHVHSEHHSSLEIHKNCDGILLSVILDIDSKLFAARTMSPACTISASVPSPLRILGKVTEAERQKHHTHKGEDEEQMLFEQMTAQQQMDADPSTSIPIAASFASDPPISSKYSTHPILQGDRMIRDKQESQDPTSRAERNAQAMSVSSLPTTIPYKHEYVSSNDATPETSDDDDSTGEASAPKRQSRGIDALADIEQHILPTRAAQLSAYANRVPTLDIEELGSTAIGETRVQGQKGRQFRGCSSCAARGDRELLTSIPDAALHPSKILNHFRTQYRHVFERLFTPPILQNMSQQSAQFFAEPPFEAFATSSPSMLQVYTVLAVSACISGYLDSAQKFWSHAIQLAKELITLPLPGPKDTALLADGLNRISFYFGSGGDAAQGAYFNRQAIKCLHLLATSGHSDRVYALPVYETALWSYTTYNPDRQSLDQAFAWAVGQHSIDMQCYTVFLKILCLCIPDLYDWIGTICNLDRSATDPEEITVQQLFSSLHPYRDNNSDSSAAAASSTSRIGHMSYQQTGSDQSSPNALDPTTEASNLLTALRHLYYVSAQYTSSTSNIRYALLANSGFIAMEAWLKGDRTSAASHAKTSAIQASLLDTPQFPALIPTYFAAFVCCFEAEDAARQIQTAPHLAHSAPGPFADYAELCIKAFTHVSHYRWVRILVDYFIHRLNVALGRQVEVHTCPLRDHTLDE